MHTHSQVKLQSGADILAIAKPGKKDTTSSAATQRSNIRCPAALQVAGIEPLREPEMALESIDCWWIVD
jgi:hypothetical protein